VDLSIYLIGQITQNPITYEWRKRVREYVANLPEVLRRKVTIIDPCNNQFSRKMLEDSMNGVAKDFATNVVSNKQARLFPAIDKAYVKRYSNACMFNANHYSPETPFLGTIFELAWYHDQNYKPVVGVYNGDVNQDYLCKHPFVQDTVHAWAENEIQALNYLLSLLHD
jgi:hypothetical protein